MSFFVAAQATYTHLEIGIFQDALPLWTTTIEKNNANKNLIPILQEGLISCDIDFSLIQALIIHAGPAPFTTLRVLLSTINGIGFATKKNLIQIDGLKLFSECYKDSEWPATAYLLNAFNRDLYCAFEQPDHELFITTFSVEACISYLEQSCQNQWRIIGNGVSLYENEFKSVLKERIFLPPDTPSSPSLQQLIYYALQGNGFSTQQLLPLYLKQNHYKKSLAQPLRST